MSQAVVAARPSALRIRCVVRQLAFRRLEQSWSPGSSQNTGDQLRIRRLLQLALWRAFAVSVQVIKIEAESSWVQSNFILAIIRTLVACFLAAPTIFDESRISAFLK